jgi:ribosomal protein S18 acetylase RimI-like enzyme
MPIEVRPAGANDEDPVLSILEAVVRAGDTFVNDPDSSREAICATWVGPETLNFVAELNGMIAGAYVLKPNNIGLGSHIANASFAVAPGARRRGVGRTMGEHAIAEAERRGFRAIQFNAVVAENEQAIALWESLGFEQVGRIPGAFHLRGERFVDTLVMYRALSGS